VFYYTSSSEWEGKVCSSRSYSSTPKAKRGWPREGLSHEVVAKGTCFPSAPKRSDPWDRPSTNFPNPKVVWSLKRMALKEKYLLPNVISLSFQAQMPQSISLPRLISQYLGQP